MELVPQPAKKPRNTKRQREAGEAARRETKRQLLISATAVFLAHGYAATSVSAIAENAHVSVQTLYLAWGTKRDLFIASVLAQLTGNDEELEDAAWRRNLAAQLTTARHGDRLRDYCAAYATMFCTIAERAAPAWKLIRDAAGSDPAIAAEWRRITLARHTTTTALLETFPSGLLPSGPSKQGAIDAVWALAGPETFDLVVGLRSYSVDQFRIWLTDAIERALTRRPGPDDHPRP